MIFHEILTSKGIGDEIGKRGGEEGGLGKTKGAGNKRAIRANCFSETVTVATTPTTNNLHCTC